MTKTATGAHLLSDNSKKKTVLGSVKLIPVEESLL